MFKSLFNKDSFKILKNKKLLIAVAAVVFIPILYAGMFLWAFWDPYAYLEDVPVAVVNEDDGYDFEGEHLEIGNELIDKLEEEAAFNFHFVNKETGYEGLNNQEYYILIEIPNDFSKNATTVIDEPEQLELIYVPNESFNFLAAQMGETAMLQIQQALQEEITRTYAETVLDRIDDVKDMLAEAEDATEQLNDGAHELSDGTDLITTNLMTLSEKMGEFSDGVDSASNGVNELQEGTSTLASGIQELYDNSEKLKDASGDIQSGAGALSDGLNDANDGVKQLEDNLPTLIAGTNEVNEGLTTFHHELPKEMAQKLNETVLEQKDPLRQKLNETILIKKDEYSPIISKRLSDDIANGAADTVVTEANGMIQDAPDVIASKVAEEITSTIESNTGKHIDAIQGEIEEILSKVDLSQETIDEVINKIDALHPNYETIESVIYERVELALSHALEDVEITPEQQAELEQLIKDKAEPKINEGVQTALDDAADQLDNSLDEYETLLLSNLDDLTHSLEKEVKQALNEPIGQLQDGITSINDGQVQLYEGVQTLSGGTNELVEGSKTLYDGQTSYLQNMNQFTKSFLLANDGTKELVTGTNELSLGMNTLQDGSKQLSDGTNELSDGSVELQDGMITLVDGTEEFYHEMNEATTKANDIQISDRAKDMIASPVDVENDKINEVPNYGTGFAPYFLSLGLFVGALLLSIVYPLRETSSIPSSGFEWFLRKFGVLAIVGVLQALIACAILMLGLGIEVQSVPKFLLFAIITSLTFITLIQFFVTVLDDPGRFIAIIILILQLTTSAGTFPLELIPKVLQPINLLLPMTYSVAGFKAVISSGDYSALWQNTWILIGYITLFIIGTLSYFIIKYKKTYQKDAVEA